MAELGPCSDRLPLTTKILCPSSYAPIVVVIALVSVWLFQLHAGVNPSLATPEELYRWGANSTSAVQSGEYWRVASAMLLHGGAYHLTLNVLALWFFGRPALHYLDNTEFLVVFVLAGIIGNALSLHFGAQAHVAVGSSAAVLGVVGIQLPLLWRPHSTRKDHLRSLNLVVFITGTLIAGMARNDFDNAAHIGGLAYGLVVGIVASHCLAESKALPLRYLTLSSVLIAIIATVSAPPAKLDQATYYRELRVWQMMQPDVTTRLQALDRDITDFKSGRLSQTAMLDRMKRQHLPAMQESEQRLSRLHMPKEEPIGRKVVALATLFGSLARLMEAELTYWQAPSLEMEDVIRAAAARVKLAREDIERIDHRKK